MKFLAIILSILNAFFFVTIIQKIYTVKTISYNITAAEKKLASIKEKDKANMIKQKKREKDFNDLSSIFFTNKDNSILFEEITGIEKKKIKLLFFKSEENIKDKFFLRVKCIIKFSGEFKNIVSFLRQIAEYKRLINIDKIDMRLSDDNGIITELACFLYVLV